MALADKQIDAKLAKLPEGRRQEAVAARNAELARIVASLRSRGDSHAQVAERLGLGIVKAQVLAYVTEAEPAEPTPENVVKLRNDDKLSWGRISAATGLTENRAKKVYAEATGTGHRDSDLGRGGRPPKATRLPTKTSTKKATERTARKAPTKATTKTATSKEAAPRDRAPHTNSPS